MGKASKQQDHADKNNDEDDHRKLAQEQQPLQAVLLADDWNNTNNDDPTKQWGFQPLLLDHRPKLLSPLLDRPMIEYTIRYLATQHVDQVVIVCVTRVVADYVTASIQSWRQQWNLDCVLVHDTSIANAGDALRELDKRSLIHTNGRPLGWVDSIAARIRDLQTEDAKGEVGNTTLDLDNDALVFGAPTIIGRQEGVDVVKELKAICLEYEDTSPIENLAIELNSYKFSQNATYSDCTLAATLAIIDKLDITNSTTDGKLVADFKNMLGTWKPLLQKMSIGLDEEKAVVVALQQAALLSPVLSTGMSFRFLLQTLHDEEVVSEESILSWASDPDSPPSLVEMKPVQEFLEWLQEESDSDEDDSSDEEDSE